MTDSLNVRDLLNQLEPVSNLHNFALWLPELQETHINNIVKDQRWAGLPDQSREVYTKWLEVYPKATWKDVVEALIESKNNTLADQIAKKHKIELPATKVNVVNFEMATDPPTLTVPQEDIMKEELLNLHSKFPDLMADVIEEFERLHNDGSIKLSKFARYAQECLHNEVTLTASKDVGSLFDQMHPYYDFLDCDIINELVKRFLKEERLVSLVQHHVDAAQEFSTSTRIEKLMENLSQVVDKVPTKENKLLSPINVKITSPWKGRPIRCLYVLIKFLISRSHPSLSIFKHNVSIKCGSLSIDFFILSSSVEATVQRALESLHVMKYIGIFFLSIGETTVLQDEENVDFSFDQLLFEASEQGEAEAVEFLLDVKADANYETDGSKTTSLMISSEAGHSKIVEMLLQNGADSNMQNEHGWTALIGASKHGHKEVADLLLQNNADPNLRMVGGWTALMDACDNGHYEIAKQLLLNNADPNFQTKRGWSALLAASENGHLEVVELLLQHNADPSAGNRRHWTALMSASENRRYRVVQRLLSTNAIDPNAQTVTGWTALMAACEHCCLDVAELLVQNGADPNVENENGWTALTAASKNGYYEVAKLLLDNNADPNIHHINGSTALMMASQSGHADIAELLLRRGADPNIRHLNGVSALSIARQNEHSRVVQLLRKYRAEERVVGEGTNG